MARSSLDLLPIYSLAHDRHQHPAITACYAGDTDTTPSPPAPRLGLEHRATHSVVEMSEETSYAVCVAVGGALSLSEVTVPGRRGDAKGSADAIVVLHLKENVKVKC